MTLDNMAIWILSKLEEEAGTSSWWTSTQIKAWINELYRDLSMDFDCLSTRDTTTSTVIGTARYVIPKPTGVETIKILKSCDYDVNVNGILDFYTIDQLNAINPTWRGLSNGTPWGAFFEHGDENLAVSLVPAPGSVKTFGFDYNFVPSVLTGSQEPYEPFKDGIILKDGVMSMALAMPGGGRDLDRSDYYFGMFTSRFSIFTRHKSPVWRGLKSIDDARSCVGRVRLPSNYPSYHFDD
jgi:hypothetical protein